MQYTTNYNSPLGNILLAADQKGLSGLWFYGSKYFARDISATHQENCTPILQKATCWLDIYFSGENPTFLPPINMMGSPFQLAVWNILLKVPYGKTITYKEIAEEIAKDKGVAKMSAQAVGGAVGHNKISIIVPCHRVIGANGNLTGYAGGIDKKVSLLTLEKTNMKNLFLPKSGTAL